MTDKELMQKALANMECMLEHGVWYKPEKIIAALRDRLAQPEQKPVAWYCKEGLNRGVSLKQESPEWKPLFGAQFDFKPLTDKEADELIWRFARYELLRAVEAAHGIKGEV